MTVVVTVVVLTVVVLAGVVIPESFYITDRADGNVSGDVYTPKGILHTAFVLWEV